MSPIHEESRLHSAISAGSRIGEAAVIFAIRDAWGKRKLGMPSASFIIFWTVPDAGTVGGWGVPLSSSQIDGTPRR